MSHANINTSVQDAKQHDNRLTYVARISVGGANTNIHNALHVTTKQEVNNPVRRQSRILKYLQRKKSGERSTIYTNLFHCDELKTFTTSN